MMEIGETGFYLDIKEAFRCTAFQQPLNSLFTLRDPKLVYCNLNTTVQTGQKHDKTSIYIRANYLLNRSESGQLVPLNPRIA